MSVIFIVIYFIVIFIIIIIIILVYSIINYIKYLKLKVNDLKNKNEVYLHDFNNLVINIKKLEPYNKNIKNFNNAYINIVNKYNILKNISIDIKKANNISNIITLTYTDYYNEMSTIIKIHNDFNEIKNHTNNNNVKNTINLIKKQIYDFEIINNKSKYKINFDLNIINKYFNDALIINSKIIDVLDIKYIDVLRQYYKQIVDLLKKSQFELIRQKKILESYHNAEKFIHKNVKYIPIIIDEAYTSSCSNYVPSYIKIKKYDIIKKAKLYIPDYSKKNVISSKNKLEKIIDDLTYYKFECNRYEWNNKRKKKRR